MNFAPFEDANLREIESLNQRGGRTLSILDLVEAGTLDVRIAAYFVSILSEGASVLTAARPGGAGKSTLLANLLGFLPPDVRIRPVSGMGCEPPSPRTPQQRVCHLAHEIGTGAYYGYIWGEEVPEFFALARRGDLIASCLHADTLDEVRDVLLGDLLVPGRDFERVNVLAFMHIEGGFLRPKRRVSAVYERGPGGHALVFRWDPERDSFEECTPTRLASSTSIERWRRFLEW
ncbi:MAG: hypothetical protein ACE5O2_08755, partial [Armatimonadota bacterium]